MNIVGLQRLKSFPVVTEGEPGDVHLTEIRLQVAAIDSTVPVKVNSNLSRP